MPPQHPTPEWQPVSKLPLLTQHIDGWLAAVKEEHETLQEARERPYVLDDSGVQPTLGMYIKIGTPL